MKIMATRKKEASGSFICNPDVVLRQEDPDGALLFNPDTNQIRVINTTGLFIWKQCDGEKDFPAIVSALKKDFDGVPDKEVGKQVNTFIDDMRANGFLGVPAAK
jgi:hypothetical protein